MTSFHSTLLAPPIWRQYCWLMFYLIGLSRQVHTNEPCGKDALNGNIKYDARWLLSLATSLDISVLKLLPDLSCETRTRNGTYRPLDWRPRLNNVILSNFRHTIGMDSKTHECFWSARETNFASDETWSSQRKACKCQETWCIIIRFSTNKQQSIDHNYMSQRLVTWKQNDKYGIQSQFCKSSRHQRKWGCLRWLSPRRKRPKRKEQKRKWRAEWRRTWCGQSRPKCVECKQTWALGLINGREMWVHIYFLCYIDNHTPYHWKINVSDNKQIK